jgi:cytochrome c oxidase assembly factor CtaG
MKRHIAHFSGGMGTRTVRPVLTLAMTTPLTTLRVFTAWRAEPGVLATAVVLGGAYAAAVARTRRAGRPWPRVRIACWTAGIATILLVGCSFLGVYDDTLFWVRAVQNIVLLMVVPLLLALGAPILLLRDLLPARVRAPLGRVLRSPFARFVTFPLVITVLLVVPMMVLYLSPLYELTLRSSVASAVSGFVLALVGFGYFWTRFRLDPTPRTDPYGVTIWITVVEMIGDAALGVVLWLGPLVAAGFYGALTRDWGPSVRTDQTLGAGVLWIGGDVAGLPFIGIVLSRMTKEDEVRAAEIDVELDAVAAAEPDEPPRLWWQDVPEIADRFHQK